MAPTQQEIDDAVERILKASDYYNIDDYINIVISAAKRMNHYRAENIALRKQIEIYKSAHKDELQ